MDALKKLLECVVYYDNDDCQGGNIVREVTQGYGRLRKAVDALAAMARRSHYDCDDNWYACPLSNSGCSDPMYAKDECNCGAAEHNRQVDAILAMAQPEPR
jgi:hypothetical protein